MEEASGRGRVGSGRVGSDFLSAIAGRVGSGQRFAGSGRVGSKKSDPWTTLDQMALGVFPNCHECQNIDIPVLKKTFGYLLVDRKPMRFWKFQGHQARAVALRPMPTTSDALLYRAWEPPFCPFCFQKHKYKIKKTINNFTITSFKNNNLKPNKKW